MNPFPSKSKCIRTLREVYPGAHFAAAPSNDKGPGLELRYNFGGGAVPVVTVNGPNRDLLPFAVVRVAFARLGYSATWNFTSYPPRFDLTPIPGFVGPEDQIPVELDPREPLPSGFDSDKVSQPDGGETPNENERPNNGHREEEP